MNITMQNYWEVECLYVCVQVLTGVPKSTVVSSNGLGNSSVKGTQAVTGCVVSQPQLITTQAPTAAMLSSQAQLISPIQVCDSWMPFFFLRHCDWNS